MNENRYAIHPDQFATIGTDQIRDTFLVDSLFQDDEISTTYTHYDRLIIGGAKPVTEILPLVSLDSLKSDFFLQRREIGIINVGGNGKISVDGTDYNLSNKEAL